MTQTVTTPGHIQNPNFLPAFPDSGNAALVQQTGGIQTLGAITPGTLYTAGTYNNVPLTGGSGSGAMATITVAGGAVTAVTITPQVGLGTNAGPGSGYKVGDVLSAAAANIGGTGSGFTIPVTRLVVPQATKPAGHPPNNLENLNAVVVSKHQSAPGAPIGYNG